MIKVVYKNSSEQYFEADNWDFSDVASKNVCLRNNGKVIIHLNWDQIRYMEKVCEEVAK